VRAKTAAAARLGVVALFMNLGWKQKKYREGRAHGCEGCLRTGLDTKKLLPGWEAAL
jgi:hypothetical protein